MVAKYILVVTSIPQCAEEWMITETNKKSLQKDAYQQAPSTRETKDRRWSRAVGRNTYLVPTDFGMTDDS